MKNLIKNHDCNLLTINTFGVNLYISYLCISFFDILDQIFENIIVEKFSQIINTLTIKINNMKNITLQDFKNKYPQFSTIQHGQYKDVAYSVLHLVHENLFHLLEDKTILRSKEFDVLTYPVLYEDDLNALKSLHEIVIDFQKVFRKETMYK